MLSIECSRRMTLGEVANEAHTDVDTLVRSNVGRFKSLQPTSIVSAGTVLHYPGATLPATEIETTLVHPCSASRPGLSHQPLSMQPIGALLGVESYDKLPQREHAPGQAAGQAAAPVTHADRVSPRPHTSVQAKDGQATKADELPRGACGKRLVPITPTSTFPPPHSPAAPTSSRSPPTPSAESPSVAESRARLTASKAKLAEANARLENAQIAMARAKAMAERE